MAPGLLPCACAGPTCQGGREAAHMASVVPWQVWCGVYGLCPGVAGGGASTRMKQSTPASVCAGCSAPRLWRGMQNDRGGSLEPAPPVKAPRGRASGAGCGWHKVISKRFAVRVGRPTPYQANTGVNRSVSHLKAAARGRPHGGRRRAPLPAPATPPGAPLAAPHLGPALVKATLRPS